MTAKKEMTDAQQARQRFRSRGKYAKVYPCYVCGESAGEGYFSDRRTDTLAFGDVALVLCSKCATEGDAMSDEAALAFYRAGKRWGGAS